MAALPGQEFVGEVDFVDPVVQLPGRTILIKAVVPNPKRQLQAG
ncbi:MAG: efflux RND transporter periplasmic adaptor subunit, partial [Gemmatimonadales bacterium]